MDRVFLYKIMDIDIKFMRFVLNIASVWQLSTATLLHTFSGMSALPALANPLNHLMGDSYTLNWQAIYLVGTLIVALLIAYESIVLKKNLGKLPQSTLFSVSSILETVWLMVSVVAIYYGGFSSIAKVVPFAYILYSIFGWIYGFYLLKDQADNIKDVDDMSMPIKYMDYSLSFSLVITVTSIAIFINMLMNGVIAFNLA